MSPVLTLAAAQLRADLRHRRSGKLSAGRLLTTVMAYGFSGAVLALSLGSAPAEQALFVGASFGMVLSAFGVVGSYDDLMGRPRDNAWLTTLPASEAAHYGARLLGISVYVGLMTIGIALPVGLRVVASSGAALGLMVGVGITASIVWTSLAALLLLWTLTLTLPRGPLRWAIGVARAVLIGALVLGFQLVGSQSQAISSPWWPAAWLADAFSGRPTVGLGALALSLVTFAIAFGVLIPRRYFRLLRRLADGARRDGSRSRLGRDLTAPERWMTRPGPLRASYGFAAAAFADDRLVRGRLWPAVVLPIGFVIFGWLSGGLGSVVGYGDLGALEGTLRALQNSTTQLHLSVVVVLLFCVQSLVQTVQHSDHAEAAWVFSVIPDAPVRVVQLGAQQALTFRALLPLHVATAVVLSATMPALDAVLHAAYWFAVAVLFSRLFALAYSTPPFSRGSDKFDAARRFVPILVSIPTGVGVIILQIAAFASRPIALAVILGLLAVSAIVGEIVVRWPRGRTRTPLPKVVPTPLPA